MEYRNVWEASEIGSAFPLARAERGKMNPASKSEFFCHLIPLSIITCHFWTPYLYDPKTHSLPSFLHILRLNTSLFTEIFNVTMEKYQFQRLWYLRRGTNQKEQKLLPGWAVLDVDVGNFWPWTEPSWARTVGGTLYFVASLSTIFKLN